MLGNFTASTLDDSMPFARDEAPQATHAKAMVGIGGLRAALMSGRPGGWASDHRAETEHFRGWNYIAIRAIAMQALQAAVNCYVQRPDRAAASKPAGDNVDNGDPLPAAHPLAKIMRRPNPKQSGGLFRYEQVVQLQLTGTCLTWNLPNRLGKPVERYVVPLAITTPEPPSREHPRGAWRISPEAGRYFGFDGWFESAGYTSSLGIVVPAQQMQVIRWPHPIFRDDGQSPSAAGALWIDTSDQVDQSRWGHLRNGVDPSLLIGMPEGWEGDEADLERAATKFNQKYSGSKNTGKAIFTTGAEVTKLTTTPAEMAYKDSFTQLRDAGLALHGTPGVAAGVTDSGSYAAFYAALLQFCKLTCQPIFSMLAEEDTEHLAPYFGELLVVEMLAASIDDPAVLEQQLRTDTAAGVRKLDEFRAVRGLPLVGGAKGEEFVGGAMAAAGVAALDATGDESSTGKPGVPRLGAQQPVAQPQAGQADQAVAPQTGLNGAQVTAAVDVLNQIQAGTLAPAAGAALLEAIGIPTDKAQAMVNAQANIPKPDPATVDATTPKSRRFATNGHAKDYP